MAKPAKQIKHRALPGHRKVDQAAAIVNSIERAESLCITPPIMERYIDREDPECYLLVESWQPRKFYQRFIVHKAALDAV